MKRKTCGTVSKIVASVLAVSMLPGLSLPVGQAADDEDTELKTIFDSPAIDWESECTQIGNGFMGAMLFGGMALDKIQLNEHTIWAGGQQYDPNYDGGNSGTAETHYDSLSKLRANLQQSMINFTENNSAYIDANGKLITTDTFPALTDEETTWLNSLRGLKGSNFGQYQELGNMYFADYLTDDLKLFRSDISAISSEGESATVANLVDRDNSTDWVSEDVRMPISVSIDYKADVTFKAYKITSTAEGVVTDNDPAAWTLYGSNDGESYEEIDTQSNISFRSRNEEKIFELDEEVTYQYIKLEVEKPKRNGSNLRIAEFSLLSSEEVEATKIEYTDYRRELDLKNSIATVTYKQDGIGKQREYFMSYPNNFMGVRLTSDGDNDINKYIYIDTLSYRRKYSREARIENGVGIITMRFNMQDETNKEVEEVAAQLRVYADGGTVSIDPANPVYIHVEDAEEVRVYMSAGTNYVQCWDDTFDFLSDEDPLDAIEERLDTVEEISYDDLKAAHIADYQELFGRVELDLCGAVMPEKTTPELVKGYKGGTNTELEDRYLEMLYYQFGRYLLISCSREGSLPANLQGVWCQGDHPTWNSDYHANINVQMNYWLTQNSNLAECHEPMISFIKSLVPRGERTAQLYHYDVREYEETGKFQPPRGWVSYHENNIWGNSAPGNSSAFYFPVGGAWLCQDIWEYYAFSLDKQFLEDNFYVLLGSSLFWVDNLVTDLRDGTLVTSPAWSPEHGEYSMGTSADQVIIWELFTNTLKAAEILGIENSEIDEIRASLEKLHLPKIGLGGQYQEWKDEIGKDVTGDGGHKHVNHLFAVYPGTLVVADRSEEDDKYVQAMKNTLNTRGDGGTGWSKAWKICLWARLRDGDRAGKMVSEIIANSTLVNLFDTHTPFQIDGNFGATAGMAEMLLQSQGDSVDLLPALPSKWNNGSVSGLRARGDVTVDMEWQNGKMSKTVLVPGAADEELKVKYDGIARMKVYDSEGQCVNISVIDSDTISFAAEAGETYTIESINSYNIEDSDAMLLNAKAELSDEKVDVTLTFGDVVGEDITAYYAIYDTDKSLAKVSMVKGDNVSDTLVLSEADIPGEHKVMVWNENQEPILKTIDVKDILNVNNELTVNDASGTEVTKSAPLLIETNNSQVAKIEGLSSNWKITNVKSSNSELFSATVKDADKGEVEIEAKELGSGVVTVTLNQGTDFERDVLIYVKAINDENAFLETFSLMTDNGVELISGFDPDVAEYGTVDALISMETIKAYIIPSDDRLTIGDKVEVDVTGGIYDQDTGVITLDNSDDVQINVTVTSFDDSKSKTYSIKLNRTYYVLEDFSDVIGSWGFVDFNKTYITEGALRFAGLATGEYSEKEMDSAVSNASALKIEFDWQLNTDLSSSGRSVSFELRDINNNTFFGMHGNTNNNGIKYTTNKNAFKDDGLDYTDFPSKQSKNSDWYSISLTVDFQRGDGKAKILEGTVKRAGSTILTLKDVDINAVNFDNMHIADTYSVSSMSIDNVKISKADIDLSPDATLSSVVIKKKPAKLGTPDEDIESITEPGSIKITNRDAVDAFRPTEFIENNAHASVKAVKYSAGNAVTLEDFNERDPYKDEEEIFNGDFFIVGVTAQNGDTLYYRIDVTVTDGSEDAFLTGFSVTNGSAELVKGFVYDESSMEVEFDYGLYDVASGVDKVVLSYVTSDERLMSEDTGSGGVSVDVEGGSYNSATGVISLAEGENKITVTVQSFDGTETKTYTFIVNRTAYILLEQFDSTVPSWWYSQYTDITITEDETLYFNQGNGSGPRSARGWAFESTPIASGTVEIDFDLKMTAGNHSSGNSGFFIVGGNPSYKGNSYFDYTGGVVGIYLSANTSSASSMSILSGSGDTANPTMTTINNPAGESKVFPWAHVNLVIDISTKQTTIKITGRDVPDEVWFEGTVDGFIDSTVTNLKGFQLTMGRANGHQEIDNLKVKQY